MISVQAVNTKPPVASVQRAVSVRATLDGAVFGNGVFVGPDQQAEVEDEQWMLQHLNSGGIDQEVRHKLSEQIYKGHNATGTDSYSSYTAARGEKASRLLTMMGGDQP